MEIENPAHAAGACFGQIAAQQLRGCPRAGMHNDLRAMRIHGIVHRWLRRTTMIWHNFYNRLLRSLLRERSSFYIQR